MRKVINKNFIIFSLILVLLISLFFGYKSLNNKKDIPEKYKTNNERKQFAIFIKNSENNQYETYEGDSFPEGYRANLDKSLCTDINGNIVKDVISNSDNGITVTSNKTVSCEIYLDKFSTLDKLLLDSTNYLNKTEVIEDELEYRYQGTFEDVKNNYICFGTSDKNTCINDTDKYMYRIIGIDKSNRLKLIKKEALNTAYSWNNEPIADITWPNSDLYKGLNADYFLENKIFVPNSWENKIDTANWKYGRLYGADILEATDKSAAEILHIEQGFSTIVNAKIGLMYMADYYYALNKKGNNCSFNGEYQLCGTNWVHIAKNDLEPPIQASWFMNWVVNEEEYNLPIHMYGANGGVGSGGPDNRYGSWPVFYLVPEIEISGTGSITDPYIIVN